MSTKTWSQVKLSKKNLSTKTTLYLIHLRTDRKRKKLLPHLCPWRLLNLSLHLLHCPLQSLQMKQSRLNQPSIHQATRFRTWILKTMKMSLPCSNHLRRGIIWVMFWTLSTQTWRKWTETVKLHLETLSKVIHHLLGQPLEVTKEAVRQG